MIINVFKCTNGEYIKQYDISEEDSHLDIDVSFCESPFDAYHFSNDSTGNKQALNERISGKFVQLKLAEL